MNSGDRGRGSGMRSTRTEEGDQVRGVQKTEEGDQLPEVQKTESGDQVGGI